MIEGVDFLPAQVAQLSTQYRIRAVFLGCSRMTLEGLDQFPGRSRGYASLPEKMRRQIVQEVPLWSQFIRQEAKRFGYPYVDMAGNFAQRLREACVSRLTHPKMPTHGFQRTLKAADYSTLHPPHPDARRGATRE